MEQLTIKEKHGANYVLFELEGAITSYTFSELKAKIFFFIYDTNIVLDLSRVTAVDSSGLSVILGSIIVSEENDYRVYLMRPSIEASKAVDSTGFSDIIPIIYSVTEVL